MKTLKNVEENKKRLLGFTLAEVLITLGIIGVVAAITLPVLMQNIKGAQFISKFKKELSALNQAVTINKAKYDWDFSDASDTHGAQSGENKVEEIFTKNLKVTKSNYYWHAADKPSKLYTDESGYNVYDIKLSSNKESWYGEEYKYYMLSDGAVVSYYEAGFYNCTLPKDMSLNEWLNSGSSFDTGCIGYIDVNGPQLPNKEVSCATGTTSTNLDEPCTVDNNSIGDIFPVVYHDSVVVPASNAAAAVLGK